MGRREYLKAIYNRYHRSAAEQKGTILDEFCEVCSYNRKYAIRLLNGPPPGARPRPRRTRGPSYGRTVIQTLAQVWEAAGYPWSVRLRAMLPLWLPWLRQRLALTPELERQLRAISPRQIDRRLQSRKRVLRRRLYGRTKPGTLLKHHIPIKTDHWDVTQPGFTEIDLVSHSGECAEGEFAHSFNLTDIHTTWTETYAVLGKGETGILAGLEEMRRALPFALCGIDSDNGSEFLNHHLVRYCRTGHIQFTRGRPYKKDDNAHIEQKNWTHVRKLIGWDRYDSPAALGLLNDLYRSELRLMMNLFQPSVKLLRKERVGSRLRRAYDRPQTPLDRLRVCRGVDRAKVNALLRLRATTDPFELARIIEKKLDRIAALARHRGAEGRVTKQMA
ncbi:ISNCY family transposase [Actinokineospora sp.]|uniref:ISNCY family transposase n=1 Tax=Actinokineospora sp. TaxID=1872133 RepID=UPI003D6BD0FB